MADEDEKPSLRVLYNQGERDEFFKRTMPKPPNVNIEDFRIGLNADIKNMELVETMVQVGFEKSGLSEFDALDDPDALIRLNVTVLDLVKSLAEMPMLSEAPEWWTSMWCQHVIEFLWKERMNHLARQKEEVRHGKQPEPATEPAMGPATPVGLGIAVPPVVTLQNMAFQLALESNKKGGPVVMEELAATRCLKPSKPAHQASSYSLQEFIRQFELVVNKSRDTPLRLIHGNLGYYNKVGQFKPILRQQNFEVALLSLFNNRGGEYTLKFIHREENSIDRNNRLAAEAAALRLHKKASRKAGNLKNKPGLLYVPDQGRGRTGTSSSRLRSSPPPNPPPQGPLPRIPTLTPKSLAVYNSPERSAEREAQTKSLLKNNSRSTSRTRAQLVTTKPNVLSTAGADKSLPPIPTSRIPKGPPVKPIRNHSPPPISRVANKGWQKSNKSNPPPFQGPRKAPSPESSSTPKTEIKRGGTSRVGLHVPSDGGIKENEKRSLVPVVPTLKPMTAQKTREVVVPQPNHIKHFSDSEEAEVESLSGNPIDQTSPKKIPRKPYRESLTLKENLFENVAVPIGHGIQIAGRRVSRLIAMASPKSTGIPGRGSAEYYPDRRRKSLSSTLTRVATAVGDTKLVVKPATKKTLGLVKIPTPKFTSRIDNFELRGAKYKTNFEVIVKHTYRRGGDEYVDDRAEVFKEIEKQLKVGEVDDHEADLDDDEKPKTPGEYMIEQLQKMQNMPELAQMYDHGFTHPFPENFGPSQDFSRWKECCQLFQLDPNNRSVDERVVLAGLKTPLYLYQAFGVYWQMKTSRMIGGGFVGDETGLGKTLSFLAYIVAERQLAKLWEEIRKWRNRELKAVRHLEADECGIGAVCPRARRRGPGSGWIACPCASPMSATLSPKSGVRLAVVPPSLVPTWVEQWDTHIDESNGDMSMRLIIAHDGTNKTLINGQLDVRDGRNGWSERNLKSNRMAYHSKNHPEGTEWFTDEAQHTQERLLVVTTREHWHKTWSRKFEHDRAVIWSYENTELGENVGGKAPGIVYGIAMIDECHEDWQKNKGRSGVLANLPRSGRPFVWGYSGTPITTTPRCIEGVLWAIENLWPKKYGMDVRKQTGLEQHPELWQFSWQRLDAICKEFEDHAKTNKGSPILFKDFYQRFKPFLTMLMIRRTADTPWFGQPIIKLPPHTHEDIFLKHNTEFDLKIEQFGWVPELIVKEKLAALHLNLIERNPRRDRKTLPQRFTFNAEMRIYWQMRIIASFPYLVTMGAAKHPQHLDLTVEELKKFRGIDEKTNRNPYYHKLQQIVEHSPKMMWLYNFITELDKTKDVNGEEQKVVIMSEFNQVTFIIKLFLEKFVQGKSRRVGLVYHGLKPSARKAIIEAFTDAKDEKGNRKQNANYQYLVGTTRIIGSGLQLTRSCNVIMMEPDYEFYRELQGYARVHRIGQKNPESRSYRLINAGNPWEKKILERQVERGEFPGKPDADEDNLKRYGSVTEIINLSEESVSGNEENKNDGQPKEDKNKNEEDQKNEETEEDESYITDMLDSFPKPGHLLSPDFAPPPVVISSILPIGAEDLYSAN